MGFESMDEILFGEGFGCITDIEFGPDGYLYVVSISDNAIYRIYQNLINESYTISKKSIIKCAIMLLV